jgi:hypothetical protein
MIYQINEKVEVIQYTAPYQSIYNGKVINPTDYIVKFRTGRIIVFSPKEFNELFKPETTKSETPQSKPNTYQQTVTPNIPGTISQSSESSSFIRRQKDGSYVILYQ